MELDLPSGIEENKRVRERKDEMMMRQWKKVYGTLVMINVHWEAKNSINNNIIITMFQIFNNMLQKPSSITCLLKW